MRLVNVENIRLVEFNRMSTPEYAILSHVWGKEEVTFQDIHDLPKARQMLGYDKIKRSCEQARRHGFQYVWIDTCCIDKSSSSELSESINSMFKWYQDATVCYAYLNDTSRLRYTSKNADNDHTSVFQNSRWFTRGWTLQELIAPKRVEFYGQNWLYIGSKITLCDEISRITHIPQRLLRNPRTLRSYSIAQRMSWAGGRSTTRLEDKAYAILGIVGVNMPLLYGEGSRAFIRLQEEIIKISTDESLFAWSGTYLREDLKLDMLAPDPAAFELAREIVPLPTTRPSYSITNKGLQIELPLLQLEEDGRTDEYIGILNCHFESDFSGYVGICLKALGIDTNGIRHYVRLDICKVSEESSMTATSMPIIIQNFEDSTLYPRRIYLQIRQKTRPQIEFTITPLTQPIPDGSHNWHPTTSLLQVEADGWIPAYIKLGFSFYSRKLNWAFVISTFIPWAGRKAALRIDETETSKSVETWSRCSDDIVLREVAHVGDYYDNKSTSAYLVGRNGPFPGDWEVHVLLKKERMLKQEIWVLEVELFTNTELTL